MERPKCSPYEPIKLSFIDNVHSGSNSELGNAGIFETERRANAVAHGHASVA